MVQIPPEAAHFSREKRTSSGELYCVCMSHECIVMSVVGSNPT